MIRRGATIAALALAVLVPIVTTEAAAIGSVAVDAAPMASAADSAGGSGLSASLIRTGQADLAAAVNSATDTVYIGTQTTDLVVVNGATGAIITTLNLGAAPRGIAVDSTTNTVYVSVASSSGGPNGVDVINGATNTVTTTITEPDGVGPDGLAVDSATDTIYETEQSAAAVAVIDGATSTIATTISTGTATGPCAVAVDQTSGVAWVVTLSDWVLAINAASDSITHTIQINASETNSIAVNAATDTVYVTGQNVGVVVIDGATAAVTTTVPTTEPAFGVAVDPGSGTVYATSIDGGANYGTTWVISGDIVTNTIARGGWEAAVDSDTGVVFEANRAYGSWMLTPSASDAMSPLIVTVAATFTTGVAKTLALTASALPAATFTETGALPAGVTLTSAGALTGTPAADSGGTYPVTITASNGVEPDFTELFTLTVLQPPTIAAASSATATVGTALTIPITVTGYPAPWVQTINPLPAGVSLNQSSEGWQLSGTPVAGSGGVYTINLEAYSSAGQAFAKALTLTVTEAPAFTSPDKATFRTGRSLNFIVSADAYPGAAFTRTGKLPAGLHLDSGGLLWGTPAARSGAVYRLTFTATNDLGSVKQAFTLTIKQAPAFTSARSATFKAGHLRQFIFRTTAFPVATLSERGRLPAGLKFRARHNGTAALAGRPARTDRRKTYVITVIARNGVGAAVRETFRLKVS
ncbi:MAG TPA: putative Ig domain-containing protein [Streptosporangiaceae bacterium]|nr:putative Ig domain-containing protein [Streptosporangiaceae bacterium]